MLSRAHISIKRLLCFCFRTLQHWFLSWTRPPKTSLLLGTVVDLARGKSELVAENTLLRHQLIILRRQITRPMLTKRDRIILVLLARTVRTWRQALLIVQPETILHWHRQGCAPNLEVQVKSHVCQTKGESLDYCIDQRYGQEQSALGC